MSGPSQLLTFLLALLGLFFNHTGVVFGVNLSFTDPILLIIMFLLVMGRQFCIPSRGSIFFVVIAANGLAASLLFVPWAFSVTPGLSSVIQDLVKLAIGYLYFVAGVNLARIGIEWMPMRWLAIGALAVALLAVIAALVGSSGVMQGLFLEGVRFKGLFNDPNLFGVMQVAVLAYIFSRRRLGTTLKMAAFVLLTVSVMMSGSKTAIISLVLFLSYWMLVEWRSSAGGRAHGLKVFVICGSLVLGSYLATGFGREIDVFLRRWVPSYDRIAGLSGGLVNAASSNGSSREEAWGGAVTLITNAPVTGVGFGSYQGVLLSLTGHDVIAHNTYLQLAAEWGLPLAGIFLVYLSSLLVRGLRRGVANTGEPVEFVTLASILFVLLLGSWAVSLDHLRFLWFLLGVMVFRVEGVGVGPASECSEVA